MKKLKLNVPTAKVIFEKNGKKLGYTLLEKKIRNFANLRASAILKYSPYIFISVKYPDGMKNEMTAKNISDVKWAIKRFYQEYRKDWL